MRRIIAVLCLLVGSAVASAEHLRITTWNLNWFPGSSTDGSNADAEERVISEAAAVLSSLDTDVIVLQEIRDLESSERVAQAIGSGTYKVALCSEFTEDGSTVRSRKQIAILTRRPIESSWSEEWNPRSWLRPPGGYVFAAVRIEGATVGVFGVHLKNNLTRGNAAQDMQVNILQREISVDQLLTQVERLETIGRDQFDGLIIAGNFNTNPDEARFISERTLPMLRENGFVSGFENMPLVARVTCPGRGRYSDTTFDYIFAKNATLERPPSITSASLSDHFPVTLDLSVFGKPLLPPAEQAAGAAPPSNARHLTWILAAALLIGAAAWFWKWQQGSLAVAMPLEGGQGNAAWEARVLKAEEKATRATALVRSGLLPHFARLMADKLIRNLLLQRREWVENQNATAAHVAHLEERLTHLQPKIQARLEAYEKRIAELEHELTEARRSKTNAPGMPGA